MKSRVTFFLLKNVNIFLSIQPEAVSQVKLFTTYRRLDPAFPNLLTLITVVLFFISLLISTLRSQMSLLFDTGNTMSNNPRHKQD